MSNNYNSTLQSNNIDLQAILNTINELPNAGGSDPVLQDKTVSPTTSKQTITADSGYDGLDTVTVNAMPTATQATPSITINASGLITTTATQTSGYVVAGTKSATKQLAFQAAKTITPSTASQIAVSGGYYTGGNITVAAVPTQSKTVTPTSTTQNITPDSGKFLSKVTVNGDSDLVAGNIKSGVNIFGVTGTYVGSGSGDMSIEDGLVTRNLTSYTNDRVTSIGSYAFAFCKNLTTASFQNVKTIGENAFQACSKLKSLSFPTATSLGYAAFSACSSISTVSFPAVKIIDSGCFRFCRSLTTASFPSATSIGSNAFYGCSKLKTINAPMVTSIASWAFYSCYSLNAINFPNVLEISTNAFGYCSSITTASFSAVKSIATSVFSQCHNLKSLYLITSSVCKLGGSNAFSSTPIGGYSTVAGTYGSIYVPTSLLTSYKTATNWTYFSSRFVGI